MALPDEVKSQLEHMQTTLTDLQEAFAPFLNKNTKEIDAQYDSVQRAQIYDTLAHSAATLFNLYLKVKGVNPDDHSFSSEQKRLQQYHKKVRKLAAQQELRNSGRELEVDVAAMNRFIAAAVPDLTAEQRAELKQVGVKSEKSKRRQEEEKSAQKSSKKWKRSGDEAKDAALNFLHETLGEVRNPTPGSRSKPTE